ncbi:hypothetical protein Vafri_17800 [Volvox africanus]|uniref:Transmembrane protein n=1 Tax=Volvox africanus TaxID=51714 RepID=A0A8J4BKS5_9CHLO|nr:hypothetical protein Vafri_17800 [Volvox africanus]
MEDAAIYTAYYSHYQIRAADAAAAPPISRKRQGAVCVFLAFGAACGMSTVAVGFFAHKPAIVWPVVAVGLLGVTIGLVLAHRKATGDWWWRSPTSNDLREAMHSATATTQGGSGAALGGFAMGGGNGGRSGTRFHLPMYCADALDVEMGIVHPPYPLMLSLTSEKIERGHKACGAEVGSGDGTDAADGVKGSKATSKVAGATTAVEFGTVMCGFPLPGADGWIDTRPVLVLQPHPQVELELRLQPPPPQHGGCVVAAPGKEDAAEGPGVKSLAAVEASSVLQLPADVQQSEAVASVEVSLPGARDVLAPSYGLRQLGAQEPHGHQSLDIN